MGEAARVLGGGEADVLALALRAMADGVAIVDRGGRIRFVNQALAEAWGAPTSAIVGRRAANFLDVSRIEAGRLVLDRRVMDLRGLVAQAVDQHAWSARRKGLALSIHSGALPSIVADESQMERVVGNLIGNAIKYTPEGGAIRVMMGRQNGHVTVAVRDTGRGIPAHELPHLFERYRRVRDKHRTEGTGLGLFIAKTIVEAHGGQIHVESAPGIGSTFTVLLPA